MVIYYSYYTDAWIKQVCLMHPLITILLSQVWMYVYKIPPAKDNELTAQSKSFPENQKRYLATTQYC